MTFRIIFFSSSETHSPTLPCILLRVINYAGKLLALREGGRKRERERGGGGGSGGGEKIAATIWRQPQFLPDPPHICSPAVASRIPCNAFRVSTLRLSSTGAHGAYAVLAEGAFSLSLARYLCVNVAELHTVPRIFFSLLFFGGGVSGTEEGVCVC